jgi:hypothetical protein
MASVDVFAARRAGVFRQDVGVVLLLRRHCLGHAPEAGWPWRETARKSDQAESMADTGRRHRMHAGDDLIHLPATIMSGCWRRPPPVIAGLLPRRDGIPRSPCNMIQGPTVFAGRTAPLSTLPERSTNTDRPEV